MCDRPAALVLADQAGIISRVQALAGGHTENDIRRLLRRREWVVVHSGVYVNHTGQLTWLQRAWAAVLFAWPAALTHASALRAAEGPGKQKDEVIQVAVAGHRRINSPDGVLIRRTAHLDDRVSWNHAPPRVRYDEAVLDVAIARDSDLDALGVLAAAVGSRRTTACRLLGRLEVRLRSPRRAWLAGVLEDIALGTCSVLEHGYLDLVERAHDLPSADRQRRVTATLGVTYRDAEYAELALELDGRVFHDSAEQRDRDLDRDLDAAVDGQTSIRLGYGQVFGRPCLTARRIGVLLQQRGWTGAPTPCGPGCRLDGA